MYSKIQEQQRQDLEARYDQITKEIQALRTDLGRAIYEYERLPLEDRLSDRERERVEIAERLAFLDANAPPVAPTQRLRQPRQPTSPFIGLRPFGTEDAGLFFGREALLQELLARLNESLAPLLIVNGLSGVGKSSLLSAGLVPALLQSGHVVVHASLIDSPELDVIEGVRRSFPEVGKPDDMFQALQAVCLPDRTNYLIIDQLERAFPMIPDRADHQRFWRGLRHLASGPTTFPIQIVLSVRSDWLYALQSVPTPQDISLFNFLFLVEPFGLEDAKQAFLGPLDHLGVTYDLDLVDLVIQDLSSENRTIAPPHIQIVGEALFRQMQARTRGTVSQQHLTVEDYQTLQGARAIIRKHLEHMVEVLGPDAHAGWQILLRLVSSDGRRLSKRTEEIQGNLSLEAFTRIVNHFTAARLLTRELSSIDGVPVFTLTHDYLIEEINQRFQERADLQDWKRALHYIDSALADWLDAQRADRPGLLMDKDRYLHVWDNRDSVDNLTTQANLFLLQSAVNCGHHGFAYWMAHVPDADLPESIAVVIALLNSEDEDERSSARTAILEAIRSGELKPQHQVLFAELLWRFFDSQSRDSSSNGKDSKSDFKAQRKLSAGLLWALRSNLTSSQRLRVAPVVSQSWLSLHGRQIALPLLTAGLVLLLTFAVLAAQQRLRGSWTQITNLHAGPVAAAALASDGSGDLWAVTPTGPKPGQGLTVLLRPANAPQWRIVSESVVSDLETGSTPPASLVAWDDTIFLSVFTRGILRSTNQGMTWELINRGLGSYDIRELVINSETPSVIYAAAGDQRGVFRSTDGGDNWEGYSDGELFGASVNTLVWTKANGGTLLAGTEDGRIALRKEEDTQWQLVSAWAGFGAVNALVVEPNHGLVIHAGSSTGTILRSDDAGQSWYLLADLRRGEEGIFQINALAGVSDEPDVLYLNAYGIGGNRMWRMVFDESGEVMLESIGSDTHPREEVRDLLFAANDGIRLIVSAGEGGLFESYDQGDTWRESPGFDSPLASIWNVAASPLPDGPAFASTLGAVFTSHDDNLQDWRRGWGFAAEYVREVAVDPNDPAVAYGGALLSNEWAMYVTRDGGRLWTPAPAPAGFDPVLINDVYSVKAVANSRGQTAVYAGTIGCGVLYWPDTNGPWETWGRSDCQMSGTAPAVVIDMAPDPRNPEHIVVAADSNRVYVSRDAGRNWLLADLAVSAEITALAADPGVAGRYYLVAGKDGLWYSDDGGLTWMPQNDYFEGKAIGLLAISSTVHKAIYVASSSGEVWRSTDGGLAWLSIQDVAQGFNISRLTSMTVDSSDGSLLLGSENGMYRYVPGSLIPKRSAP